MNSLKKRWGILLLSFIGGPGTPLLNLEGGPETSLLNLRAVPGPTFKFWGGSLVPCLSAPNPGVLVSLLHHAINYKVPQNMFKNVPHVKKMCQECKWNIWSSFLFLTLSKLLMKLVWVIKSLFYCCGTGLLHFLTNYKRQLHKKVAI